MALRGWRLFGVAGTIFVYVTGILLLSLMSIQHPEQRRIRRSESLRHHELGIINRKPPLQWCTKLRFIDNSGKTIKSHEMNRLQTFPGHFVKHRIAIPPSATLTHSYYSFNRNHIISHNSNNFINNKSHGTSSADIKTSDLVKNNNNNENRRRFDDSYKSEHEQQKENSADNEIYKFITEPWPSGRYSAGNTDKSKNFFNNNNKHKDNTNNLASERNIKNNNNYDHNLVALVSFPGSGNTWLRYLLQQATGILTGSVYKDYGLLKSGFPAESISNSSVLVVKTHEWGPNAWGQFSKAILLVRDPKKAILAEFNRQSGGHVGFANWNQFVANKLWAWEQTNLAWAKNFTGDTLVVYYDKLVDDVEGTLRTILNFIEFPIDEDLLNCALLRQEGIYRRKKRIMPFDPFTPAMHVVIDEKRTEVYAALGREI
uniref:CSON006209 protein n=1 Tax=Culicoides sonorensis TaxID=179676 RepID=A0A336MU61_CULSO